MARRSVALWMILALWLPIMAIGGAWLMWRHHRWFAIEPQAAVLAAPALSAPLATELIRHVLVAGCPCSLAQAKRLAKRAPLDDEVVLIAYTDVPESALALRHVLAAAPRSWPLRVRPASEFRALGIEAAPAILIDVGPHAGQRYAGSPNPPTFDDPDGTMGVIALTRAGRAPQGGVLRGCPISAAFVEPSSSVPSQSP